MGRLRAAVCLQPLLLLLVVPPAMTAESTPFEQEMQLTLQLSAPSASDDERELLRREYRLTQSSSEFWIGFDSLNARIHDTAAMVRSLRGLIEGSTVSASLPPSWLTGLDTAPAKPASPAALPRSSQLSAPKVVAPQNTLMWAALGGAVLALLTLLFLRRQAAKDQIRQSANVRADMMARTTAMPPSAVSSITPPPALGMPPQASESLEGLKRQTVPAAEATSPRADPVREEMDHALDLAEVMLSYGRTTGAMQTLKDYLHGHPTVSVRPWLKMLGLYRQTGMREDFEQAAETVHRYFNVKVPGWDEGVSEVPLRSFFGEDEGIEILGLEQLPHILAKIQATWPGISCGEYLRHLLVDNRDGGRMGFPVSVVAEILLLEDILDDRLAGRA